MIKNKYQIYKMSGNYTEEEIKSIEGRSHYHDFGRGR